VTQRDWLNEGVDPDDFEAEYVEYDPGMTDEELDAAHADMLEWLQDTAPVTKIDILTPFVEVIRDVVQGKPVYRWRHQYHPGKATVSDAKWDSFGPAFAVVRERAAMFKVAVRNDPAYDVWMAEGAPTMVWHFDDEDAVPFDFMADRDRDEFVGD
jgi:hypothetical protein